jgi:hypothetical protein
MYDFRLLCLCQGCFFPHTDLVMAAATERLTPLCISTLKWILITASSVHFIINGEPYGPDHVWVCLPMPCIFQLDQSKIPSELGTPRFPQGVTKSQVLELSGFYPFEALQLAFTLTGRIPPRGLIAVRDFTQQRSPPYITPWHRFCPPHWALTQALGHSPAHTCP